jgi:rubrerythrin
LHKINGNNLKGVINMRNQNESETEKNLYKTFAVEARTNNIYIMFAETARKEGYQWIAEIFETIARNELAHSRAAYKKYLGNIKETKDNLKFSMDREENVARLYKEFERTARLEGFDEVANFYKELSEAEVSHVETYANLINRFNNGGIFCSEKPIEWICMNCGYIHEGKEAPEECPCCGFPKAYFKPRCSTT